MSGMFVIVRLIIKMLQAEFFFFVIMGFNFYLLTKPMCTPHSTHNISRQNVITNLDVGSRRRTGPNR